MITDVLISLLTARDWNDFGIERLEMIMYVIIIRLAYEEPTHVICYSYVYIDQHVSIESD